MMADMRKFGYMRRAIQDLHATLSHRPHSSAAARSPDAYLSFVSDIERSANIIRSELEAFEVEVELSRLSHPEPTNIKPSKKGVTEETE